MKPFPISVTRSPSLFAPAQPQPPPPPPPRPPRSRLLAVVHRPNRAALAVVPSRFRRLDGQLRRRRLLVALQNATFSLTEEDHTLANALRFTLNQDPRVIFCGYSIPHPSEARVNVRVQTTGDPAREVLKDACQDLMLMCQHIRGTFNKAVNDFRTKNPPDNHPSEDMDSD
ncbi:hypothetical protein NL676_039115 [Syzygium grande]|nr:hypothetical protein NL676_039115 [Syzygium grande]